MIECSGCGATKPESEFKKNSRKCKACFNAYMREYKRRKGGTPCACGCGGKTLTGRYIRGHNNHRHDPDGLRSCARCKQAKPVERFGVNRQQRDGLDVYCKDCRRALSRKHAPADYPCACGCGQPAIAGRRYAYGHRPAGQTRKDATRRARERRETETQEERDARNAKRREAYAEDPEPHRQRQREYQASLSPEERTRRGRANNVRRDPAKVLLNARAQKARRKRDAPFTPEGLEYVSILLRDPCSYCGGPGGGIDHIVAIKMGGGSDFDNLTAACRSCNSRKRDRPLLAAIG